MISAGEISFIREHLEDDIHELLLSKGKYPHIDIPRCVTQIEGLRKIRDKVPEWFACRQVFIPSALAAEQCSSAETAGYKRRFIIGSGPVVDITGGLGVDTYFFSKTSDHVIYAERDEALCKAAAYNFGVLGVGDRIDTVQAEAGSLWSGKTDIAHAALVYADPSRRDVSGRRLYNITEYSPDVTQLAKQVLRRTGSFLVKISPLADISRTLSLLPGTAEVHVVSAANECKELLFLIRAGTPSQEDPLTVCRDGFAFHLNEESGAAAELERNPEPVTVHPGDCLYEPEVSLLKAGAFALPVFRFGVCKLHRHSHLYISSLPVLNFPGRKFRVADVIPFSSGNLRKLAGTFPKANMTVRNFPLSVDLWRKKTGISEGGTDYLFGTTVSKAGKDVPLIIHATKWEKTI